MKPVTFEAAVTVTGEVEVAPFAGAQMTLVFAVVGAEHVPVVPIVFV